MQVFDDLHKGHNEEQLKCIEKTSELLILQHCIRAVTRLKPEPTGKPSTSLL
jgi:hypothetical protein